MRAGGVAIASSIKWYTPSHGNASKTPSFQAEVGIPCCEHRACCGDNCDNTWPLRLQLLPPGNTPRLVHRRRECNRFWNERRCAAIWGIEPLFGFLEYIARAELELVSALRIRRLPRPRFLVDDSPPLVPLASHRIGDGMALPSRQATSARPLPRLRLRPDRQHDGAMSGVRPIDSQKHTPAQVTTPSNRRPCTKGVRETTNAGQTKCGCEPINEK